MQIPVHCSEEIGFPLNCPTSASPKRVFSKIPPHFQTLLPLSNFCLCGKSIFQNIFPLSNPSASFKLFQTLSNFCLCGKSIFQNIFPLSNPFASIKLFQNSASPSPERVFSKIISTFKPSCLFPTLFFYLSGRSIFQNIFPLSNLPILQFYFQLCALIKTIDVIIIEANLFSELKRYLCCNLFIFC